MAKQKLDLSGLRALRKRLKGAVETVAEAGHVTPKIHPTAGRPMAEIGLINHKGGTTAQGFKIPPRPYIAQEIGKPKYKLMIKAAGARIINGKSTGYKELRKIGPRVRDGIKGGMGDKTQFEGNAPWTLELKDGRDTPLVDRGHLRRDVRYKLEKKNNAKT